MTDHAGFLADIIEHPDDDTPRLIYADWLEEHADAARAKFIRAQCQAASAASSLAPFCPKSRQPFSPSLPADKLTPEYRRAFLAPLLALGLEEAAELERGRGAGFVFSFRRGFVEQVEVLGPEPAERFLIQAAPFFALTPLRDIRFDPVACDPVDQKPYFGEMSPEVLRQLVNLPNVARLESLGLAFNDFTGEVVPILLSSPFLDRVRLFLGDTPFSESEKDALRERFGERVEWDRSRPDNEDEEIPY